MSSRTRRQRTTSRVSWVDGTIPDRRLREKSYGEAGGKPQEWLDRRFVLASWIKMSINSLDYVSFRAVSGSITTLREDDYFHNRQVVSLGDTRHLAP